MWEGNPMLIRGITHLIQADPIRPLLVEVGSGLFLALGGLLALLVELGDLFLPPDWISRHQHRCTEGVGLDSQQDLQPVLACALHMI